MLNDNLIVYSNEYTRLNTQSLELKRKIVNKFETF